MADYLINNKDVEYWEKEAGENNVLCADEQLVIFADDAIGYGDEYKVTYAGIHNDQTIYIVTKTGVVMVKSGEHVEKPGSYVFDGHVSGACDFKPKTKSIFLYKDDKAPPLKCGCEVKWRKK